MEPQLTAQSEQPGDLMSFDANDANLEPNGTNAMSDDLKHRRVAEEFVERSQLVKSGHPSVYFLQPSRRESASLPLRWFEIGRPDKSKEHKTIILMGATGSGKSRLVDAMVNYVLGVRWEDPFRFRIVPEEGQSQALSQTRHITSYTIHHVEGMAVPYSLTIIDTPGFGDTGGLQRDEEIARTICSFLTDEESDVHEVNAVGFVASNADVRLTPTQKYVISSVLSLFGKDVIDHIRLLVTFSDGGKPPVAESCLQAGFPLTVDAKTGRISGFFKFHNSVLFAINDSSAVEFDDAFWQMGQENFTNFFSALEHLPSKSLEQTKKVVEHRKVEDGRLQEIDRLLEAIIQKRVELGVGHEAKEFAEIIKLLENLSEAEQQVKNIAIRSGLSAQRDFVDMIKNRLERDKPEGYRTKIAVLEECYNWGRGIQPIDTSVPVPIAKDEGGLTVTEPHPAGEEAPHETSGPKQITTNQDPSGLGQAPADCAETAKLIEKQPEEHQDVNNISKSDTWNTTTSKTPIVQQPGESRVLPCSGPQGEVHSNYEKMCTVPCYCIKVQVFHLRC